MVCYIRDEADEGSVLGMDPSGEVKVTVRYTLFKSATKSWEALCDEAASFASTVGRDRLINISVSQADTGGQGVIFVWYWA